MTNAYVEGFCKTAEAYGVDLVELVKFAQFNRQSQPISNPPIQSQPTYNPPMQYKPPQFAPRPPLQAPPPKSLMTPYWSNKKDPAKNAIDLFKRSIGIPERPVVQKKKPLA